MPSQNARLFTPLGLFISLSALSFSVSAEWKSFNTEKEFRYYLDPYSGENDDVNASGYDDPGQVFASIAFNAEYSTTLGEEWDFNFVPFARYDGQDDERSNVDFRELSFTRMLGDVELTAGLSKVFWGQTESNHLVDIVNQSDTAEELTGGIKLGQPMVKASLENDLGLFDFFVLPYHRKRTYAGENGRPRPDIPLSELPVFYEDDDNESHIDYAFRYSNTVGDLDFGLSAFNGTARRPLIVQDPRGFFPLIDTDEAGASLVYPQTEQYGLDASLLLGEWIYKAEAIKKMSSAYNYFAYVHGFEYTISGVADSDHDLTLFLEKSYDSRKDKDDQNPGPMQNDWFLGYRWMFNNTATTQISGGLVYDEDYGSKIFGAELSHRLTPKDLLKIRIQYYDLDEAQVDPTAVTDNPQEVVDGAGVIGAVNGDPLASVYDDDNSIQIRWTHYFK